jgi:hypothetical protein
VQCLREHQTNTILEVGGHLTSILWMSFQSARAKGPHRPSIGGSNPCPARKVPIPSAADDQVRLSPTGTVGMLSWRLVRQGRRVIHAKIVR